MSEKSQRKSNGSSVNSSNNDSVNSQQQQHSQQRSSANQSLTPASSPIDTMSSSSSLRHPFHHLAPISRENHFASSFYGLNGNHNHHHAHTHDSMAAAAAAAAAAVNSHHHHHHHHSSHSHATNPYRSSMGSSLLGGTGSTAPNPAPHGWFRDFSSGKFSTNYFSDHNHKQPLCFIFFFERLVYR